MRKLVVLAVLAAVVALSAPAAALAGSTPTLTVGLYDNYFSPKKKTIKPGTKVTWRWRGQIDHNVFLAVAPKGVDKKKYRSKIMDEGSFVRTLKQRGKWTFVCTLHTGMQQTLTVK